MDLRRISSLLGVSNVASPKQTVKHRRQRSYIRAAWIFQHKT